MERRSERLDRPIGREYIGLLLPMRSIWLATTSGTGGEPRETNVPSSEPKETPQARVPGTHEDEIGPQAAQPPPPQGSQTTRRDDTAEVTAPERGRYRFPRSARITSGPEIRALFRRGERKRTRHLDAFVAASPSLRTRLALVVPKHGHRIVDRNRLRRQLREAVRLVLLPACRDNEAAFDIVIRARPEAYGLGSEQVRREIGELAAQLCSRSSS